MNIKQYVLQEISSEQELEKFFRLRYDCFCKSDAELFVTKNEIRIDLNYYDRNSKHYGLYLAKNDSKEPVGYFRIVLENSTKANVWVQNISNRLGIINLTQHKPVSRLPCLGIYPDTKLEHRFYTKKKATEKAGEAGRLLIVKSERSVKLSLQLIKCAFALAALNVHHAFVGCFKEHAKAYTRLGFKQYPGTSAFFPDKSSTLKEGIVLYCKAEYISAELKLKIKLIQNQFIENNCLSFHV